MRPTTSPQTPKQLANLKALAQRTATSFAYPRSRGEASAKIERLRQLPVLTSERDGDEGRVCDGDSDDYALRHSTGGHRDRWTRVVCDLAGQQVAEMSTPTTAAAPRPARQGR